MKLKKKLKTKSKKTKIKNESLYNLLAKKLNAKRKQVMLIDDPANFSNVSNVVSTGIPGLDLILGIDKNGNKGLPRGRSIEFSGPPSQGKTTTVLKILKTLIKHHNAWCLYEDSEKTLTDMRVRELGFNAEEIGNGRLMILDSGTIENFVLNFNESLETYYKSIHFKNDEPFVVIVDSIAALPTEAEVEKRAGMASQAREISGFFRRNTRLIAQTKTIFIIVNHVKAKIGVMFGSKTTTFGGEAPRFHCTERIDIRSMGRIKDGDKVTGIKCKAVVTKNKLQKPFQETEYNMYFEKGIDDTSSLFMVCCQKKIIEKKGAWYKINVPGYDINQFREKKFKKVLKENKGLKTYLLKRIKK